MVGKLDKSLVLLAIIIVFLGVIILFSNKFDSNKVKNAEAFSKGHEFICHGHYLVNQDNGYTYDSKTHYFKGNLHYFYIKNCETLENK